MPPNHTQSTINHGYEHETFFHHGKSLGSPPDSPHPRECSFPQKSWTKSAELPEMVTDAGYDSLSSLSSTSSDDTDGKDITDVFSSSVSVAAFNIDVAKEVVCAMGIPVHLVQQVINNRRLDHAGEFTSTEELYLAVDEIAQSPEKQADLAKKLYLAEESEKQKRVQEVVPQLKGGKCHVSPARLSAEMPEVAVSEKAPVDKCQLKERVRHLARENQKLKQRKLCRACKKTELATSGITFLPCGHFITCEKCSEMYDDCPACGKNIMGTVRTFLS